MELELQVKVLKRQLAEALQREEMLQMTVAILQVRFGYTKSYLFVSVFGCLMFAAERGVKAKRFFFRNCISDWPCFITIYDFH